MNIPFRIRGKDGKFDEKLEKKFIEDADAKHNMKELKGHRAVGGIRASVFNAISLEEVNTLVNFMKTFMEENME
jgi:phosphoserine aminotransferase